MAKIKITVEGFKCERCGHEWIPRNKEDTPIICPSCKSPYWNKPKKEKSGSGSTWEKNKDLEIEVPIKKKKK